MSYIVLTSFRNSLLFELLYHNSPKVHYFMADKLENYTGFTYLWCTYRGVCWICRLRNIFRFLCMDNPCRCPEIRKRKLRNIYLLKVDNEIFFWSWKLNAFIRFYIQGEAQDMYAFIFCILKKWNLQHLTNRETFEFHHDKHFWKFSALEHYMFYGHIDRLQDHPTIIFASCPLM